MHKVNSEKKKLQKESTINFKVQNTKQNILENSIVLYTVNHNITKILPQIFI